MDAPKTKAGGGNRPAYQYNYTKANPTARSHAPQSGTAAMYAGTVLREARGIVEQVHKRGPGLEVKLASKRLRAALDSLDWVCDYAASEARP